MKKRILIVILFLLTYCEYPSYYNERIITCSINKEIILKELRDKYYWISYRGVDKDNNLNLEQGISTSIPMSIVIKSTVKEFISTFENVYKAKIKILNYCYNYITIEITQLIN
jgi:hypothetical protein